MHYRFRYSSCCLLVCFVILILSSCHFISTILMTGQCTWLGFQVRIYSKARHTTSSSRSLWIMYDDCTTYNCCARSVHPMRMDLPISQIHLLICIATMATKTTLGANSCSRLPSLFASIHCILLLFDNNHVNFVSFFWEKVLECPLILQRWWQSVLGLVTYLHTFWQDFCF